MQINKNNSLSSQPLVPAVNGEPTPLTQPPSQEKRRKANPAAAPVRLRVEDRLKQDEGVRDTTQRASELKKMKFVLAAKQSQRRMMDQWSRMRFVGKVISLGYLDELASDIAWLEARVTTAQQLIARSQPVSSVQSESTPRRLSSSLGKGA
jgi:hypothetical protein